MDSMLNSMMAGTNETVTKEELKSLIFSNSKMNMLASTVQGTIVCDGGGHEVDQNWLCSTTEVPTLNSRVVGISRMSRLTNMGDGANEVKFLILILSPTNIKGKIEQGNNIPSYTVFSIRYKNSLRNSKDICHSFLRYETQVAPSDFPNIWIKVNQIEG